MESIGTVKVIAASANLRPLLQAAFWEGQIATIFHRSLLCTTLDERLLHLHTGPSLVSPFSLRIEEVFTHVLREAALVQGMPVRKSGAAIAIAQHIHLRLDEVTYYQSPSPRRGEVAPEAVRLAWQVLMEQGRPGGLAQLPGIQALVTAIQQAFANSNPAQVLEAARRLIGLGPGLTPSGDDFLVGCLKGLWLIGWNEPAACQTLVCLREALLPALDMQTTRVGAEFIRYALDGAFAEVLDQAARSLLAPSRLQVVQSVISRLLAQGETSGTDTTLGLLTCLRALSSVPDRGPRCQWLDAPSNFPTSAAMRG